MYNIKIFAAALIVAAVGNAHAFRCGTHLINEGDSASRMIQLCGTPTSNNYSTIVYQNKDGDHMDYTIHVNSVGMIDSITFSRGQ